MNRIYLLVLLIIFGQVLALYINNQSVNQGSTVLHLEETVDSLKLQNALLKNQIASYSAIRVIDEKARRLGYRDANIQYILK